VGGNIKNWIRIVLVFTGLIGSTAAFGYWTLNQFNQVFDNLGASYIAIADASPISLFDEANEGKVSITLLKTASNLLATTTSSEFNLLFPQKGKEVYADCTYMVPWQSTTTNLIEIALVDAGTKMPVESRYSGLAREYVVEDDSQNFKWRVGAVWPGEYYLSVSKIDGVDQKMESNIFKLNRMPANLDKAEVADICLEANG
jgi:hypothetical protein